jgi:threonine/homoserine/homoserine lactone efflux protein
VLDPGFLSAGILLGLSAGFAPGPLLAFVIAESLRHGGTAGVKASLAPIITDIPIVVVAMFLLSRLSHSQPILGGLSVAGGLFVLFLGWEHIRSQGLDEGSRQPPDHSLRRGAAINALSPHPYLFWLTVGGPITWRALEQGILPASLFVGSFYVFLLGSKIAVAVAVGRSRKFLSGRITLLAMRALGFLLCLLGLVLLRDGIRMMGLGF